ncbi:MAG: SPOR domain-containing protein [Gammaproteobacteria bacterium]|nr:SPOR domain-containing protein [Gammaproteobacteria bacterium]MBT8443250.1 SPOR domain-containing protein [Gammaproteobacteria bacterium]NND35528.1 SPOR domain-containing protein [Gammaproteobacteria bacterium]
MAKRRKTRRKTRRRTKKSTPTQGWVWGLFGLGVGLSVSAFIYLKDRQPATAAPMPAPPLAETPAPQKQPPKPQEPVSAEATEFSFYDILPQFEVLIPEEDMSAQPARAVRVVEEPGVYILQAGSFSSQADADRRKAELALLDIESRFQKVSVDDKVYHRVRIGPVDNLDRLNELRGRLNRAGIDAMVIRVRE